MSTPPLSSDGQLIIRQLRDLSVAHHSTLMRAIENVFSTDLAEITMAQLVDGLILVDVVREARGHDVTYDHPIWAHKELCDGAMEKYRALKASFDVEELEFDLTLIQSFIKTIPGERLFIFHLIELVSRAVHAVAAKLFSLEDKFHSSSEIEAVTKVQSPPLTFTSNQGETIRGYQPPVPKTLYFHFSYQDSHQYPNGIADIAAFWAEDRIIGGIFLFDRGESGVESNDIFLHSGREEWTVRVWRLLDSQVDAVKTFLTMDPDDPTSAVESPFPLFGDEKNTYRFDDYDAMAWHNIYRDRWERELPTEKNWDEIRRNTFDYPAALSYFPSLDGGEEGGGSEQMPSMGMYDWPPGVPYPVRNTTDSALLMSWRDPDLSSPSPSEAWRKLVADAESDTSQKSFEHDDKA